MSDTLEKLLAVEKKSAALVAEAEAEALRRTAHARSEARQRHSEQMTARAAETERVIEEERGRIAQERSRKNAEFRAELERMKPDEAELARLVTDLLGKGNA